MSDDLIETTLRHWVEALQEPLIAQTSIEQIALINGGCISEDIEKAADKIEQLRGLLRDARSNCIAGSREDMDWDKRRAKALA